MAAVVTTPQRGLDASHRRLGAQACTLRHRLQLHAVERAYDGLDLTHKAGNGAWKQ